MIPQLLCPQDKVGKSAFKVSQSAHPQLPPFYTGGNQSPWESRGSPRLSCFFIASHARKDVSQLQPDYSSFKPEGHTLPLAIPCS